VRVGREIFRTSYSPEKPGEFSQGKFKKKQKQKSAQNWGHLVVITGCIVVVFAQNN